MSAKIHTNNVPKLKILTNWHKKNIVGTVVTEKFRKFATGMSIDNQFFRNRIALYGILFLGVLACLSFYPPHGGYTWDPLLINVNTSVLFTLLVALTARLIGTDQTFFGLLMTVVFLVLFCPGAERFFNRDEAALLELASQCMVPFFLTQYMKVSDKSFGRLYFLMLLMGIFCSYTHNSITIPLCAAFIWVSYRRRHQFFRRACWPMVVGFVIGTGLSIWNMLRSHHGQLGIEIEDVPATANVVIHTLWDTKVFLLALVLTAYLFTRKDGKQKLSQLRRRHYLLSVCLLASLISLPFAPLGIDNAVSGICFFSMLWTLYICQYLISVYFVREEEVPV